MVRKTKIIIFVLSHGVRKFYLKMPSGTFSGSITINYRVHLVLDSLHLLSLYRVTNSCMRNMFFTSLLYICT